jgi:hypothetical protein
VSPEPQPSITLKQHYSMIASHNAMPVHSAELIRRGLASYGIIASNLVHKVRRDQATLVTLSCFLSRLLEGVSCLLGFVLAFVSLGLGLIKGNSYLPTSFYGSLLLDTKRNAMIVKYLCQTIRYSAFTTPMPLSEWKSVWNS